MTRWRPPPPRSSPYITAEGYACLQAELKGLWHRRSEVTAALSAAAAEGDRSENAEYIYRKKELREIDQRIRYLQKRLPDLKVVTTAPSETGKVFFGATITLEDENGNMASYRIMGADELDPAHGHISIDAPLARALIGKSVGSKVVVNTPSGKKSYLIRKVGYSKDTV